MKGGNRQSGAEPLDRQFGTRRTEPGTNTGRWWAGTSAASWAVRRCKTTEEVGRMMVRRFRLSPKFVDVVLNPKKYGRKEVRNAVKIMDLVRAADRELYRARRRRKKTICATVCRTIVGV